MGRGRGRTVNNSIRRGEEDDALGNCETAMLINDKESLFHSQ
jgi:hypothetical protein